MIQAWIASLLLALAAAGVQTWRFQALKTEVAQQRATDAETMQLRERSARVDEARMRAKFQGVQDAKDAELRRVRDELGADLERLRGRPDRPVPGAAAPAASACAGATGAQLYGADAAFLVRFAARAEAQRAELAGCQQRTQPLTTPQEP